MIGLMKTIKLFRDLDRQICNKDFLMTITSPAIY